MKRKHPVNLFVRDCMTKALFKLMKKMDYHDITISALVKSAGVSRNSFYRNYSSIEDILRQYLAEQTSQWWEKYIQDPNPYIIKEIFRHLLSMQEEIFLIYQAGLSYLLMEHIVLCGKESLNDEVGRIYQTAFMSGGLCGLAHQWILRGMKETPDEMQALFLMQENK